MDLLFSLNVIVLKENGQQLFQLSSVQYHFYYTSFINIVLIPVNVLTYIWSKDWIDTSSIYSFPNPETIIIMLILHLLCTVSREMFASSGFCVHGNLSCTRCFVFCVLMEARSECLNRICFASNCYCVADHSRICTKNGTISKFSRLTVTVFVLWLVNLLYMYCNYRAWKTKQINKKKKSSLHLHTLLYRQRVVLCHRPSKK